jgi:hypothetical protein
MPGPQQQADATPIDGNTDDGFDHLPGVSDVRISGGWHVGESLLAGREIDFGNASIWQKPARHNFGLLATESAKCSVALSTFCGRA